ncbi:MAG: hypothetical protein QF535_12605, partial [Anaerolineales bacterium]|nr:hypothetical protein [Anaerolineales bacterium]
MATYDFEGMFGDRYSTEQAINDAMFKEAVSFGALDRSKYAPMTASSYGQAYMGGAGMAGLLGGQHPMMKRQNLLDEIKKKYPDPRTPAELYDLAKELSTNGFGDLSMQVRQVAMEMEKNEATKAYNVGQLNKPTESWLKRIPETLRGSVMTTKLENEYLKIVAPDLVEHDTERFEHVSVWKDARKNHLADIEGLIQQFANDYHKVGITKQDIQAAIGDDAALTEKFIAWIGTHGNRDVADNLLTAMGRLNTESDGGDDGSDGTTTTTTSQTSADVGSVVTEGAGQT